MVNYTIQNGDVLLCDTNTTLSGSTLSIPTKTGITGGLCFNFHPGEDVQKNLDKTVWIIQKPGIPSAYEIGLGERIFTITTTIKAPTDTYASGIFRSLADLNALCNSSYDKINTAANRPSYGTLKFYYYGDKVQSTLYTVVCKSLWYEQRPGAGTMFDLRIALSEVSPP